MEQNKDTDLDVVIVDTISVPPKPTESEGAKGTEKTVKEPEDPFRRRNMLMRTPPKRALSLPNVKERSIRVDLPRGDLTSKREEDKEKRKREGDSPVEDRGTEIRSKKQKEDCIYKKLVDTRVEKTRDLEDDEDGRTKLLESVQELIGRVNDGVANLYSITSSSRNTRVEIKEEAERLVVLMKKLTAKNIGNLMERQALEENRRLRAQNERLTNEVRGLRNQGEANAVSYVSSNKRSVRPARPARPRLESGRCGKYDASVLHALPIAFTAFS